MEDSKPWMPSEQDMQRYKDALNLKDLFTWNPDKFGVMVKDTDDKFKHNPIIYIKCPFCRSDNSYSLKYHEVKKIYYCEACHKSGDIISFYSRLHHWTIRKTCLYFEFLLADKYVRYDLIYCFPLPPFDKCNDNFNPELEEDVTEFDKNWKTKGE